MRPLGVALLLLLALAAPAAAGTSDCVAPPGTAAIDEYCETVPSATGQGGGGARSTQRLDRARVRALRRQGADGRALAKLLTSDGSRPAASAPPSRSRDAAGRVAAAGASGKQDEPAENPLRAVTSAVASGPTLGGGFGWTLLGITALMVAAGWLRLRGRRS